MCHLSSIAAQCHWRQPCLARPLWFSDDIGQGIDWCVLPPREGQSTGGRSSLENSLTTIRDSRVTHCTVLGAPPATLQERRRSALPACRPRHLSPDAIRSVLRRPSGGGCQARWLSPVLFQSCLSRFRPVFLPPVRERQGVRPRLSTEMGKVRGSFV